jgi:hypothetical protein
MTLVRSLITHFFTGDVSRDYCSHTCYHTIGTGGILPSADYQNHATEILAAFRGGTDDAAFTSYQGRNVQVRVYDMADAEPRPERGYAESMNTGQPANGPTELSVVLSCIAGRNIPGSRGRLFIGPFTWTVAGESLAKRPGDPLRTMVLSIGHALFNIGGENVAHVLYHPKANKSGAAAHSTQVITSYNVADAWGVVHSRGQRPTNRMTLTP